MKKLLSVISVLLFIIPCCVGFICKHSYTDVSKNKNPFDSFDIGLLSEFSSQYLEEYFDHSLEDDSKYILKVTPVKPMEFAYKCYSEPVKVIEVFKGDEIKINDEINIVRNSSLVYWNVNDTNGVNTGFVNKMNEGEEYLVFLASKLDCGIKTVYKTTPCIVATIFSYANHNNSIVQGKNGISSANYTDVSENEFFIEDEYSLDVLENAKEKFILKYS
ncbi:MAG: hypothetical protein IKJ59_02640 [Clostridia bacterium]|nr:hypothetical protein [Clostridia bacterium]